MLRAIVPDASTSSRSLARMKIRALKPGFDPSTTTAGMPSVATAGSSLPAEPASQANSTHSQGIPVPRFNSVPRERLIRYPTAIPFIVSPFPEGPMVDLSIAQRRAEGRDSVKPSLLSTTLSFASARSLPRRFRGLPWLPFLSCRRRRPRRNQLRLPDDLMTQRGSLRHECSGSAYRI